MKEASAEDLAVCLANLPNSPRRVVVAGNAGSGKTTVAKAISGAFGIEYVELDIYYFSSAWKPRIDFEGRARGALAGSWICDWQYSLKSELADACDVFIWLDTPLALCALRILKRSALRCLSGVPAYPGVPDPGPLALLARRSLTFWWAIRTHHRLKREIDDVRRSTRLSLRLKPQEARRLVVALTKQGLMKPKEPGQSQVLLGPK